MPISFIKMFFTYVSEFFNIVGVSIIATGIIYSTIHFLWSFTLTAHKHHIMKLTLLRTEICNSIVLGLDFMVAATVIESVASPGYNIAEPDYYGLGLVALMIVVRIAFSYYLAKELDVLGLAAEPKK